MKTLSKVFAACALIAMPVIAVSCTSENEDALFSTSEAAQECVTEAEVTFTYTVPEDLLRYAEITVCHNNNDGTDAQWFPMHDSKATVTYDLSKFPVTVPVVLVYDTTNRTAHGVDVDWEITMDVEVTMTVGGEKTVKTNSESYRICGDLGSGLDDLMRNVLDRTYAVKLTKTGNVGFVH